LHDVRAADVVRIVPPADVGYLHEAAVYGVELKRDPTRDDDDDDGSSRGSGSSNAYDDYSSGAGGGGVGSGNGVSGRKDARDDAAYCPWPTRYPSNGTLA